MSKWEERPLDVPPPCRPGCWDEAVSTANTIPTSPEPTLVCVCACACETINSK